MHTGEAMAGDKEQGGDQLHDDLDILEKRLDADPALLWDAEEKAVRKSLRVPYLGAEPASVQIDGKHYELFNIGSRGLGVVVDDADSFVVGENLPRIDLTVRELVFPLQGEVMHVTADGSGSFCCGIRLRDLTPEQERMIRRLLLAQQAMAAGAPFETD